MKAIRIMAAVLALAPVIVPVPELAAQRPAYSVTVSTLDVDPAGVDCTATPSRCFRIHYVTSTSAAPATTDVSPGNGVPDYVDLVRTAVVEVYQKEIVEMGWAMPPSDAAISANGGNGRYDVYVTQIACGTIARVRSEGAVSPGSRSWMSHMQLDQDLEGCYDDPAINSGPGNLTALTELQVIRDVVAHEFHHSIQFGINGMATGEIMEGSANWMNDEAYDEINANVLSSSLGQFTLFTAPSTSLNSVSYGSWFWLRYLSERFGHGVVRDLWQQLGTATSDATTATATALAARGASLRQAWTDFAGKLLAQEWFEEGSTYPDLRPDGLANASSPHATYPTGSQSASLDHLTRRYVLFDPPSASGAGVLRVWQNGPNGVDAGAVVVRQTADGRRIDTPMTLDAANDGSAIVSGFSASPPPANDYARTTSAVLVLTNATAASDGLSYTYCAPDCAGVAGPDAAITPWGIDNGYRPPLWQTPDVWADNDGDCAPDAPGRPGCNEADNPATPAMEAEPAKGRSNTLVARVRNLGGAPVTGVVVRFRYSPYGLGLSPTAFAEIGTRTVNLAAAGDPSGNDVATVSIPWDLANLSFNHAGAWDVPGTSAVETIANFDHFCVRIVIEATGDVNAANNNAQNNFGEVPTASGSGRVAMLVSNPLPQEGEARLELSPALPAGWTAQLTGAELGRPFRLRPGELRLVTATFTRPDGAEPPAHDVVSNLSLYIGGKPVGGVSILLAREGDAPVEPPVQPGGGDFRGLAYSFHVGSSHPVSAWDDRMDSNIHLRLDASYGLSSRLRAVAFVGLSQFTDDDPLADDPEWWANASLNLQALFPTATGVRYFLQAGPGAYLPKDGSVVPGANVGLGGRIPLAGGPFALEFGADYHHVFGDYKLGFITTQLGVVWGFRR